MSEVFVSLGGGPLKSSGYLNGCQECIILGFDGSSAAHVVATSARAARYAWWPQRRTAADWAASTSLRGYPEPWCNLLPTRLCVECCAKWRAEVEAGKRPAPLRISEIDAWANHGTTDPVG